jgi:hypothetical protein
VKGCWTVRLVEDILFKNGFGWSGTVVIVFHFFINMRLTKVYCG